MKDREKIIKVIVEWASKTVTTNKLDGASVYSPYNAAELADVLIEAGIADVTEYKKIIRDLNTDVVAYRALSKADILDQIIAGQKSLIDEYKHRAKVAEERLKKLKKDKRRFNC